MINNQGEQVPWPSDVPCPCPSDLDEASQEIGMSSSDLYMMGFLVFDSADGRGSDRGVVPVMIVEVQPARECFAALSL